MARKRASMREGPLAELFRATEAAQRAQREQPETPESEASSPAEPEPQRPIEASRPGKALAGEAAREMARALPAPASRRPAPRRLRRIWITTLSLSVCGSGSSAR